jgi:hypothetical protein
MSKRPFVATVEILGEAHLPADLLTPTMGSNYGLDGYEDMGYGSGVMYGGRGLAPVTPEAPAVPTGVNRGASEHLVLDDMLKEGSNLVEHSWLSEAVQDLERLPENPVNVVPELEELWGANRPTDGLRVYERDLKQATFEDEPRAKHAPERDLVAFVAQAMRRSAMGHPLNDILRTTYLDVGQHDAPRIRAAMQQVQAEHGLAGNVFVRYAAYPKYEQGKWTEHLRKHAKGSRYLVVPPQVLKSATWVEGGRCTLTGMKVVTEVPWREAYAHYAPRLRDAGRRVASGDPREALRAAFLSLPEKRAATGEHLPTHVTPSERVTSAEARTAFTNAKVERKVYDPTPAHEARVRAALHRKLAGLAENNVLAPADRDRLVASKAHPKDVLKAAAALVGAAKNGTYEGARLTVFAGLDHARPVEHTAKAWQESEQAKHRARVAGAVWKVTKAVEHGLRGAALRDVILRTVHPEDVQVASKQLAPLLRQTNALAEPDRTPTKYAGANYAAHVAKKAASAVSPNVVQAVVGWVRRTMNEGFAGRDLDDLVAKRFASDVLDAAREKVAAVRREHEGGAGFVYVEAAAYATLDGVKGCEQGALKHRANQVKTLLAIPNKCGSCVHAHALADGTQKCALYNKVLVSREDFGSRLDSMKQANIQTANMDDQALTASLFAPTYNESEFSLHNAALDGFSLTAFPEDGKVAEIAFGGLVLNPEWK